MTCIRFALLGSGFIGQVHAASLARHERTVLSMVAAADPERAKALASRSGARAVTVAEAITRGAAGGCRPRRESGLLRKTDRSFAGPRPPGRRESAAARGTGDRRL